MFSNCSKLASLDLSSFDTSKVTNMENMFIRCTAFTTVTGVLDMSSCTKCSGMFSGCPDFKSPIHLKNVSLSLNLSGTGGTEGIHYVVDNYID